jgi:acyl dehydratase
MPDPSRRYLEDFEAGQVIELGSVEVDEAEMLSFASSYDPQPIHLDRDAAAAGAFGGLIASGWLTGSLFMRLFAGTVLNRSAALVSPGLEELRWLRPVRAGDVLHGRYHVLEVSSSERDPSRGTVRGRGELVNQEGEVVLRLVARNLFRRRELPPAGP